MQRHKIVLSLAILLLLGIGLSFVLRVGDTNRPISPISPIADSPARPLAHSPTRPLANWPAWGGAVNSAALDGAHFFDRTTAQAFMQAVEPKLRAYVVELHARSFLPSNRAAGAPLKAELFPAQPQSVEVNPVLQQAYIQFLEHPSDAQRAQLAAAGIEILNYMGGYAWTARGSADALSSAADFNFVRGLARVDPRDKLHAEVFFGYAPDYAAAPEGALRFVVLGLPGTTREQIAAQWAAQTETPALASANVSDFQPGASSFIGPRFEVRAPAKAALSIASAAAVAFVELLPPPAAPRDATTDSESNIQLVRDQNEKLDASGITVAVRELSKPALHVDFASRLTIVDAQDDPRFQAHSTEVVGVVASNGATVPAAKGVAPGVKVLLYTTADGSFATTDIADAAARGVRVSNHSYGPVPGSDPNSSIPPFGDYRMISADWDNAMRAGNHLCILAGFEDQTANFVHQDYFVGCKNGICVSASSKTANAGNPPSAPSDGIAFFSNYGPMADGRVKPDLVAFGDGVTMDSGTNASAVNQGTSFSTPAVTGVAALLEQRYLAVLGTLPSAALLKAILCQTATDLGQEGPDAVYGFGIVNARAGVDLINLRTSSGSPFIEGTLKNADNQKFVLDVSAGTPLLKATFCWMDVPGAPGAAKALVNDLDMTLTDPNGVVYFPYSLNPANPSAPATKTGPNTVDPIEQIIVQNPVAGSWTVSLTGSSVPAGPQPFAFCTNVVPHRPLAAFAIASPTQGPAPLDVIFNATGSSGDIQNYYWSFGDGEQATGISVSHTYTSVGSYVATLTITDQSLNARSTSITITVQKQVKIVFPFKASGKVSTLKTSSGTLAFSLVVPDLVRTPQQVRDTIQKGTYEGKHYFLRIGQTNGAAPAEADTFLLDRRIQEKGKFETFQIDLRKGAINVALKQSSATPVHDLNALFQQVGINAQTVSPFSFMLRVEIESDIATDDIVYRCDFNLVYTGKNGKGTIMLWH